MANTLRIDQKPQWISKKSELIKSSDLPSENMTIFNSKLFEKGEKKEIIAAISEVPN